jgi:hypothetical protein
MDKVALHLVPKKRELTVGEKLLKEEVGEIAQYWITLMNHDWTYSYSDDIRAWRAGEEHQKMIEEIAQSKGGPYSAALKLWKEYNSNPKDKERPDWFRFAYSKSV